MSNSQEQQLMEIEVSMEQAKQVLALGEALDRLHENEDFKAVILNGYMREEALRLVYLKGSGMVDAAALVDIDDSIKAIGILRSFFRQTFMKAQQAQQGIADLEDTREAVLAEVE